MLIVTGDIVISFLNPFDIDRPVIRRLDVKEGIAGLTQWQNLVMVGTKRGQIIGKRRGADDDRAQLGGIDSWVSETQLSMLPPRPLLKPFQEGS